MAGDLLLRRSERALRADPQDPSIARRFQAQRERRDPFATRFPELLPLFYDLASKGPWSALARLRQSPELGRYALPLLQQARRATIALDERRAFTRTIKRLQQQGDNTEAWIRFEGSPFLPPSVYALLGSPRIPFASTRAVLQLSEARLDDFIRWAEAWSRDPEAVEVRAENRRSWSRLTASNGNLYSSWNLLWRAPPTSQAFVRELYEDLRDSGLRDRLRPEGFSSHILFRLREGSKRRILGRLSLVGSLRSQGLRLVIEEPRRRLEAYEYYSEAAVASFVAALEQAAGDGKR